MMPSERIDRIEKKLLLHGNLFRLFLVLLPVVVVWSVCLYFYGGGILAHWTEITIGFFVVSMSVWWVVLCLSGDGVWRREL